MQIKRCEYTMIIGYLLLSKDIKCKFIDKTKNESVSATMNNYAF
jgi:hypothetical protein